MLQGLALRRIDTKIFVGWIDENKKGSWVIRTFLKKLCGEIIL